MTYRVPVMRPSKHDESFLARTAVFLLIVFISATVLQSSARGQSTTGTSTTSPQKPATSDSSAPPGTQSQTPNAQSGEGTGGTGGPNGDNGPIAIPKKKQQQEPEEKKPPKVKNPAGMPEYSIRVDVPVVNLDVSVQTKDGRFIPGLKKENFKIFEDGVEQKVDKVELNDNAPITAVLLVEFSNPPAFHPEFEAFIYDMLNGAYSFAQELKPDDWVALVSYDMRTHLLLDFTQDKRAFYEGLRQLQIPGFSEKNLYDALYDTIDRLEGIDGRKYIVLISSGVDTFSRINLDKILEKVKNSRDITIYAVSTGQTLRLMMEGRMGGIAETTYLQADNQLKTFAHMTGGQAYFPRFEAEYPEIFAEIANSVRNQYTVSYRPSNNKQDGTWRKVKVVLTDGAGGPMKVLNEKGKPVKYQVIARDGYKARQQVE